MERATTHPKKRFGQHFLRDEKILSRIADACGATPRDTIVEIGAGEGTLTTLLARRAGSVIAIEKDRDLIPILRAQCAKNTNITIVQADALRFDPHQRGVKPGFILCGNIPYYLTGAIMRIALEQWPKAKRIVFTLQEEVAQRICAKPGNLSILGVLTQILATPRIVGNIKKGSFWPVPKVDSAILTLEPKIPMPQHAYAAVKTVVRAGFSHPRKRCASNLSSELGVDQTVVANAFASLHIRIDARAQDLSPDQWIGISTLLKPRVP